MPLRPRDKRRFQKIKKDYQAKDLRNPFFASKREGRSWKPRLKLYLSGGAATLLLLVSVIFLSPLFKIKEVKVSGYTRLSEATISAVVWQQAGETRFWPFKQSNLLLFKKKQASENLAKTFNLSKVTVSKSWFHTLKINIEERPYAFIWQEQGAYAYSDNQGIIINEPVKSDDLKKLVIIENKSPNSMIDNGKVTLDAEFLNFIFALKGSMDKVASGDQDLRVDHFVVDSDFRTVKVQLSAGPKLYFNIKESIDKQLEKLQILKKEETVKKNKPFNTFDYIDLRYGDKIYYKYK